MSGLGFLCHFDRAPLTSDLARLVEIRVLMSDDQYSTAIDILRVLAESYIPEVVHMIDLI